MMCEVCTVSEVSTRATWRWSKIGPPNLLALLGTFGEFSTTGHDCRLVALLLGGDTVTHKQGANLREMKPIMALKSMCDPRGT